MADEAGTATRDPIDELIAQELLARGVINRSQLKFAQQKHAVASGSFPQTLVTLGLVVDQDMAEMVARHRGLELLLKLPPGWPQAAALTQFRREVCRTHAFLPLEVSEGKLLAWLGDGSPQKAADWIRRRTGLAVSFRQGPFAAVQSAIESSFQARLDQRQIQFDRELRKLQADTQGALGTDSLLQALVDLAAQRRASDIHIMPDASSIQLAFRVDGVLVPIVAMHKNLLRLISSIKVSAGMDISDNLRPQDGRFSCEAAGTAYDVRVSTAVTSHGESVVMRLLSKNLFISGLEDLGFFPDHLPKLRHLFSQPYGIALMAGPTGSGKTTTLYAGLKPLGMSGRSILTVEDPIEYDLPTAVQTQVNRKAAYTFDSAIKHFLRHDPDIMLVGEIRDEETAEAAVRASETGHLVLSTLHVNNVFSVPTRLSSLGVPRLSIAESLLGVVSQRLVRRLCPHCRQPDEQGAARLPRGLLAHIGGGPIYRAVGCAQCGETGYSGRLPAYEILLLDAQVSRWVVQQGSRHELMALLNADNHVSMAEVVGRRMAAGETSAEEYGRVFGLFDAMAMN